MWPGTKMSEASSNPKPDAPAVADPFRAGRRIWIRTSAFLLVLITGLILVWHTAQRKIDEKFYGQALAPPKEAFDFHLTDQDGKPFHLSQLRGKIVLFAFGFTHCPNVCPTTLTDLVAVYRALPVQDRSKVQILFISVDPRRDQPAVLRDYLRYFDPSFLGLTGNGDEIAATAKEYGTFFETVRNPGENPDDYTVNHSAYTYLITPDQKWKLLYDFNRLQDTKKIVADIERVLASR
jgi:protein SCO1/2